MRNTPCSASSCPIQPTWHKRVCRQPNLLQNHPPIIMPFSIPKRTLPIYRYSAHRTPQSVSEQHPSQCAQQMQQYYHCLVIKVKAGTCIYGTKVRYTPHAADKVFETHQLISYVIHFRWPSAPKRHVHSDYWRTPLWSFGMVARTATVVVILGEVNGWVEMLACVWNYFKSGNSLHMKIH